MRRLAGRIPARVPRRGVQRDRRSEAAQFTLLAVLAGVTVMASSSSSRRPFSSWRLAAAIFVTLPAALAGGVLAGLAGGELGSIGSLAGVFAVLAVRAPHRHLTHRSLRQSRAHRTARRGYAACPGWRQRSPRPTLMTSGWRPLSACSRSSSSADARARDRAADGPLVLGGLSRRRLDQPVRRAAILTCAPGWRRAGGEPVRERAGPRAAMA